MTTIYPKILDGIGATLKFTNGIPSMFFGYSVYENVNYDTAQYDSANTFATNTPLSEFTYTYIQDKNNNDKIIQLTIECGAYTFIFNDGEYQYQGTNLDISIIVTQIQTALGF
jgi:hypothetical protein